MTTTAVIGAGPAGMMAALSAAAGGSRVTLFERNHRPGHKFLITGAGQCNLTHTGSIADFLRCYGDAGRFLRPALYHLSPDAILSFFADRGVEFETELSGKIFPASRRASQLLEILRAELTSSEVELAGSTAIASIEQTRQGFTLCDAGGTRRSCQSLIIAAGGQSYPGTGSDGSGFLLASQLGHTIVPPRPGLTDTEIEDFPFGDLAGISIPGCEIAHYRNELLKRRLRGDLLITHRGFSGPVILNNTREIMPGDQLVPDFGGLGDETEARIREWAAENGRKLFSSLARLTAAPEKLAHRLLENAGLPLRKQLAELSRLERGRITRAFRGDSYRVLSLGDFSRAMVTVGGVSRNEINPKSMESRLITGLYFAGEVIDIDGDTGGYNLQAAFATGSLAGRSAAS